MPMVDGNATSRLWRDIERSWKANPAYLVAVSAGHSSNVDFFDSTMNKPVDLNCVHEMLTRVSARFRKSKSE